MNGERITATPKHPFYVPNQGWTDAIELRAGDRLQLLNGEYVIVEQVQHEILESPIKVYNFEVEDFHTYFVSKYSILVHNKGCGNNKVDKGPANTTTIRYDNNGKVYSTTSYGSDGNIVARIDFQGTEHYVKSVGRRIIPHVHLFQNNNGHIKEFSTITLDEYLKFLGG